MGGRAGGQTTPRMWSDIVGSDSLSARPSSKELTKWIVTPLMGEVIEPRHKTLKGSGPWCAVPGWIIRDPNLTDRALRLYTVLALMTNATTSIAFPSRATIADMMCCSTKTVDRALQDLININGVTVMHRFRPGTHEWTSSEYQVRVDDPCSQVATDLSIPRDIDVATVGTDLTLGGVTDVAAEQEVLNQNQVNENYLTTPAEVDLVWNAYIEAYAKGGSSKKYLESVKTRLEREHGDYVRKAWSFYRPTALADKIRARERNTA